MQVKRTNRQKSAVSLMITLTTIITALLTFITVSKTVPGETIPGDYRDNANTVISRGDDMASFSSSLTSISNLNGIDMEKTINTLIAGFRRDTISNEADIFEENVTNPNQLCAYMMNTSATEMYDGREIYSVRELTILPENGNSQRARAIGNVSIKLPSPEQVIILDYRRTSQTEPVTTTAVSVTTPAHETTTAATVAPPTQSVSTASPENVSEVRTTFSPVAMTTTEQSTTQSEVKTTVQPTATTKSTPDSPASDSGEEIAPVMGEKAFYKKR